MSDRTGPVRLVCFSPHPDDAELACGGWLALAARRGQSVAIVDLSAGELATNGTPEQRAAEAAQASRILQLTHRENLGLPDGGIAVTDAQVNAVVAVIRRLRPEIALAPWVEARHPDHANAGRLLQRAAFLAGLARYAPDLGAPHRPRLLHFPQRHELRPDLVVDITEVADVKRAAIVAHASQVDPKGARDTLVNHPVGHAAWEVRDRYWGASIGVRMGEPYLLGTPIPVSDPLAHFAAHPAGPALVPLR